MCSLHENSLKLGKVQKIFAVLIAAFPSASRSPRLLTLAPLPCAARSLRYRPEASPVLFPSFSSPLSSPSPPSRCAPLPSPSRLLLYRVFETCRSRIRSGGWKRRGRVYLLREGGNVGVVPGTACEGVQNRPPRTKSPSRSRNTLPRGEKRRKYPPALRGTESPSGAA